MYIPVLMVHLKHTVHTVHSLISIGPKRLSFAKPNQEIKHQPYKQQPHPNLFPTFAIESLQEGMYSSYLVFVWKN